MNGEINIAPSFQPYVDQFIEEASARGIAIDFSDTGLSMQFGTLPLGTAAQCQELGDDRRGNHQLLFDENLWTIAAPARNEFLVFHELGHCELARQHTNNKLPNGEWESMMRGSIASAPFTTKEAGQPVNFHGFRTVSYTHLTLPTTPYV